MEIPVPQWIVDSGSLEFSAGTSDVFPYGEGTKPPCPSDTAGPVTFMAAIMASSTDKDTIKSFATVQSSFECTYDKPAKHNFILCKRTFYAGEFTQNINLVGVTAVVPSCTNAKIFTDALRTGNQVNIAVWIALGIGIPLLALGVGLYVLSRDSGSQDSQHDETKKEELKGLLYAKVPDTKP